MPFEFRFAGIDIHTNMHTHIHAHACTNAYFQIHIDMTRGLEVRNAVMR